MYEDMSLMQSKCLTPIPSPYLNHKRKEDKINCFQAIVYILKLFEINFRYFGLLIKLCVQM